MKENKFSVKPDGLFRQNIVLMSGLLTAPIIVAATTAKNALILVMSFFMISYTSILICRFIPRKIVYSIRIFMYALVAGLMYIPTVMLLERLFSGKATLLVSNLVEEGELSRADIEELLKTLDDTKEE